MKDKVIIRQATAKDIPFLVETVINAEKSGTNILSYTTVFGLTEDETRMVLTAMFEEEIDGGELSLSSFMVADIDDKVASAVAGWIECACGDSSYFLKSNLISYCIPKQNIEKALKARDIVRDIYIKRTPYTIQLEYVYTDPKYRGRDIYRMLRNVLVEKLHKENPSVEFVDIQIFEGNKIMYNLNLSDGFFVLERKESTNPAAGKYFPHGAIKLGMRSTVNNLLNRCEHTQ